jgi:hypothetical protein
VPVPSSRGRGNTPPGRGSAPPPVRHDRNRPPPGPTARAGSNAAADLRRGLGHPQAGRRRGLAAPGLPSRSRAGAHMLSPKSGAMLGAPAA